MNPGSQAPTCRSTFAGFDDEVGLADGLSERIGGDDGVQSGVGFADPVEDDAVADRVDLAELDSPFRNVLVGEAVVVLGVQGSPGANVVKKFVRNLRVFVIS